MSFPSPERQPLARADLDPDPVVQFDRWFEAAAEAVPLPEAMTLATVDAEGRPDARMVLLKGHGPDGFRFFTNYEGVKAGQMEASGEAALVFFWAPLDRQVRVRGKVRRLGPEASDEYFATRDRASQIGAWASPQSTVIPDRAELEKRYAGYEQQFAGTEVPRPPHWGGYILKPQKIEFWQGRSNRLHDRIIYRKTVAGNWNRERLAP